MYSLDRHLKDVTHDYAKDLDKKATDNAELREQIKKLEDALAGLKKDLAEEEKAKAVNEAKTNEDEKRESTGLSKEAQDLRRDNEALRGKHKGLLDGTAGEVRTNEAQQKKHEDVVAKYKALLAKKQELLDSVAAASAKARDELNEAAGELSSEGRSGFGLKKSKLLGGSEVEKLKKLAEELKQNANDVEERGKRATRDLEAGRKKQEEELKKLGRDCDALREKAAKLGASTAEQTQKIAGLHDEIDHTKAQAFEGKITRILQGLSEVEQKRSEAQGELENAQQIWTVKVSVFGDAIAAMERAAENDDHLKKIQSVIIEIDERQRQLNELLEKRDELEKKIATDENRDTLNKEY